jgi:putative endonuclease
VSTHCKGGVLGDAAHTGASTTGRGRLGEQVAEVYLAGKGYRVLAHNQRTPLGELDLICSVEGGLVVVEVKARASCRCGGGLEAIGPGKLRRLREAAAWWLAAQGRPLRRLRFDAVVVSLDEDGLPRALRHYPDLYADGAT